MGVDCKVLRDSCRVTRSFESSCARCADLEDELECMSAECDDMYLEIRELRAELQDLRDEVNETRAGFPRGYT